MNIQEQQWVEAAKRGDQDAFACLVGAYEKRVFALTIRMCKQPEDAAEAAQEAFLAVWQGLPSFRGEASFSTWLYRLASNACVDILRRESRRRETLFLDGEEAPADVPDRGPTPQEAAEQQADSPEPEEPPQKEAGVGPCEAHPEGSGAQPQEEDNPAVLGA